MRISDWSSDVCSSDLEGLEILLVREDAHLSGLTIPGANFEFAPAGATRLLDPKLNLVAVPEDIGAGVHCHAVARGPRHDLDAVPVRPAQIEFDFGLGRRSPPIAHRADFFIEPEIGKH